MRLKTILIAAYLLMAFLVAGTLEFNDHLNRSQAQVGQADRY